MENGARVDDREGESLAGSGRLKYSCTRSGRVLDTRAAVAAREERERERETERAELPLANKGERKDRSKGDRKRETWKETLFLPSDWTGRPRQNERERKRERF